MDNTSPFFKNVERFLQTGEFDDGVHVEIVDTKGNSMVTRVSAAIPGGNGEFKLRVDGFDGRPVMIGGDQIHRGTTL